MSFSFNEIREPSHGGSYLSFLGLESHRELEPSPGCIVSSRLFNYKVRPCDKEFKNKTNEQPNKKPGTNQTSKT